MPRVSVIIPSYHHARFLDQRLQSVLGQTYQDKEILFLDDASPDNSLEVFAKYSSHPNVRAFYNATNSGNTFKQWNKGVRAAQGEYIWLAESDDVAEPQLLETLVSLLDKHPNVGLAYCASILVDEKGAEAGDMHWWTNPVHPTRWQSDYLNHGTEECLQALVHRNTIPNASAVVFRKTIYEQVGYADETLRYCGDWLMWVKLLLVSDVAYVAAPLNHFRVAHPHCVRSNAASKRIYLEEHLRILEVICADLSLPRAVAERVHQNCAAEWVELLQGLSLEDDCSASCQILKLANAINPELFSALLTAALLAGIKPRQRLQVVEENLGARHEKLDAAVMKLAESVSRLDLQEQRLHGMNARVQALSDSMRFWNQLRTLMLTPGGRMHRLAHKIYRIMHRAA